MKNERSKPEPEQQEVQEAGWTDESSPEARALRIADFEEQETSLVGTLEDPDLPEEVREELETNLEGIKEMLQLARDGAEIRSRKV